jgi:hypothetical protein
MQLNKILFKFQMIIPICIVILGLLESILDHNIWSPSAKVYLRFFANVIMINSLHVAFVFIFIALIPNFREWFHHQSKTQRYPLLLNWFLFFCLFSLIQLIQFTEYTTLSAFINIGLLTYAIYHTLKQNLGISILINRSHLKVPFNKSLKSEMLERKLIWLLLIATIFPLFEEQLSFLPLYVNINYLRIFSATIMIIAITLFAFHSHHTMPKNNNIKTLFLIRYFIYPLSLFSFLGLVGVGIMHGAEYMLIIYHILKTSNKKNYIFDIFSYFSIFLLILVFWLSLSGEKSGIAQFFVSDEVRTLLFGNYSHILLGSIVFLHYHIDGKLFKFSIKKSREHILPLFEDF